MMLKRRVTPLRREGHLRSINRGLSPIVLVSSWRVFTRVHLGSSVQLLQVYSNSNQSHCINYVDV
jgi:hypothetical protein